MRLEIIHLRLTGARPDDLLEAIRETAAGLGAGAARVRIFQHAQLPSDVAIHLHHEDRGGDAALTRLGLRLVSALRELGLVEHTVWEEPIH